MCFNNKPTCSILISDMNSIHVEKVLKSYGKNTEICKIVAKLAQKYLKIIIFLMEKTI